MRRRKKKHEHGVLHPDEKWLVSYADMMTLLFGLFVMLYSFAMKNKSVSEAVEKELKKVSEKGFQASEVNPDEMSEKFDEQDLKVIIRHMQREVASLNTQLSQARNELSTRDLSEDQLKRDIVDTKTKSALMVKRALQSVDSRSPASSKALASASADSVMVYIRWTNTNHDFDMSVTTPDNQELNFKNRKISETDPDEFVTDSKDSKGIELFKTSAAKAGEYEFHISLYNSHGDDSSSPVQLMLMKNGKEYLIETFTLKDDGQIKSKRLNLNDLKL